MSMSARAASVSTALGVSTLIVLGAGVATASNGGGLIVGHANHATSITTLSNKTGTPLSLKAGRGRAPLSVNSSRQVKKLNSLLLGGKSASALSTLGSGATLADGGSKPLDANVKLVDVTDLDHISGTLIVSTGTLSAGIYAVNAAATLGTDGSQAGCYTAVGSGAPLQISAGADAGNTTTALSLPVRLTAPGRIGEYCFGYDATNVVAEDGGLTAVRLSSDVAGSAAAHQTADGARGLRR